MTEDRVQIATLEAAHAEARANCRRAWDELDNNEIAMHWSGVAGWLRHRIRKLQAGEEPDWPDALTHTALGRITTDELRVELAALRAKLATIESLYLDGGPDTSCRTRWEDGIECLSVPKADIAAAFGWLP